VTIIGLRRIHSLKAQKPTDNEKKKNRMYRLLSTQLLVGFCLSVFYFSIPENQDE